MKDGRGSGGECVLKKLILNVAAVCAASGWMAVTAAAQTAPAATPQAQGTRATTQAAVPGTPGPQAGAIPAANPFPPVDAKNFTATSPSVETVNSFLHALWGMDENRMWSVAAIENTAVPGMVKVQVLVAEKTQPGRMAQTVMYITPDGKHLVAGEMLPFGAQPFEGERQRLQREADGPARGAASKDLEIVEFADLQCPSCKAAQSTMDQIVQDFPQAHVVYQNYPLTAVHPFAFQAAAVGDCVRKAKGDPAFFTYAQKVYDMQADLTKEKVDATLRAAVTAAGADPASVMTCASSQATQAAVNASIKLAQSLGISGTPTLVVNGRALPMAQVPYEGLKHVIVYQGQLDGIAVKEQPSLTTLK